MPITVYVKEPPIKEITIQLIGTAAGITIQTKEPFALNSTHLQASFLATCSTDMITGTLGWKLDGENASRYRMDYSTFAVLGQVDEGENAEPIVRIDLAMTRPTHTEVLVECGKRGTVLWMAGTKWAKVPSNETIFEDV